MEPNPENVSGEIVRRHSFEHHINWGHVALAVAALYIASKGVYLLDSDDSNEPEESGRREVGVVSS